MKYIYPVGSFEKVQNKDKPNGYAGLDENGLLKLTELKNVDFDNLSYELNSRLKLMYIIMLGGI